MAAGAGETTGTGAGRDGASGRSSGRDGDRLRVSGDVDRDAAIRAVDDLGVKAVEDQLRVTPGAFDGDHGGTLGPACDS